ncbi:MAG: hypothetical protein QOF55_1257, partial [Thermoleophilaceae bacterium]|nr:hypothetical protein [Thermoleophilaceae bacterium]
GGFTDAFADLAEFVTEYPAISADLQKYLAAVDVTTTDDDQVLTNANAAALSFVTLVENVAKKAAGGGLRFERPAPALVGDDLLIYSFTVDEGIISLDGDDALLVTLTGALPPGVGSAKLCIPGGYEAVAPPEPPAACGEPNTQCFVYTADGGATYLSAADGQKIADRTIELDGLDILQRQDALPSVYIKRNENLGCQTDFVYMTPPTHPTSPLYPTIDSSAELSIAAIGQTNPVPRTLGASFTALFAELLAANQTSPISVQLNVAYDYTLVDGLAPVDLPVFMQPPMPVDVTAGATGPGSLAQMIADWSAAITTWFEAAEPLCHGKLWFDLLILSDLTQKPMPLLRLRKLYLPIDMVTGPKLACAG